MPRSYLKDPVTDDPEVSFNVHTISKYVSMSEQRKQEFIKATGEDGTLTMLKRYHFLSWPKFKNMCPNNTHIITVLY